MEKEIITPEDMRTVPNYYLVICQRTSHSIDYAPEYVLVRAASKEEAYSKAHKEYGKSYVFSISTIE